MSQDFQKTYLQRYPPKLDVAKVFCIQSIRKKLLKHIAVHQIEWIFFVTKFINIRFIFSPVKTLCVLICYTADSRIYKPTGFSKPRRFIIEYLKTYIIFIIFACFLEKAYFYTLKFSCKFEIDKSKSLVFQYI